MKKFLAIAVIAASLVACGNKSDKKDEKKADSTVTAPVDTTKKMAPVDTTHAATPADTTHK